ncbi:MAG: hypothetical protein HYR94_28695 [Chloroflexi bacterium]|nr:hypothetical protein [Chloroflexota bacterium]
MSNLIPGSTDVLGWGFNIFGNYSVESKLSQLLDLSKEGVSPQTVNGVTYDVPDTVSVGSTHGFSGEATTLKTTAEIAEYFTSKANVNGSYGAFKGAVDFGYSHTQLNQTENTYCIFDGQILTYPLSIEDPSADLLADSVTKDADYQNLLKAMEQGFSHDNAQVFFRFFTKYGTHFISEVHMGGSLYYYTAIEKSYTSDSTVISTKASAEYNGLFLKAGAEAEAEWKKAGQEWVDNRTGKVVGIGGNTDPVSAIDPDYDTKLNDAFESWRQSVNQNPSPMGFQLRPVSLLFSDKQAQALEDAFSAYAAGQIYASIAYDEVNVVVNGLPVELSYRSLYTKGGSGPFSYEYIVYSYVAAVIDRKTGQIVSKVSVPGKTGYEILAQHDTGYKIVPDELKKFEDNSDYILLFLWAGRIDDYLTGQNELLLAPSDDLRTFLLSCGAGPVLESWHTNQASNYDLKGEVCYILVGVIGSSSGVEAESDISLDDKSPSVSLRIPLLPKQQGDEILLTPITF